MWNLEQVLFPSIHPNYITFHTNIWWLVLNEENVTGIKVKHQNTTDYFSNYTDIWTHSSILDNTETMHSQE
jgi:hypothetical protein